MTDKEYPEQAEANRRYSIDSAQGELVNLTKSQALRRILKLSRQGYEYISISVMRVAPEKQLFE